MINFIVGILCVFLRNYIAVRFIRVLVSKKNSHPKLEWLLIVLTVPIITILSRVFRFLPATVLVNMLAIGAFTRLYTKSLKVNVFVTSIIYVINVICDSLIFLSMFVYVQEPWFSVIYNIAVIALFFVTELVVEKNVKLKSMEAKVNNAALIWIPILSLALILFMIYRGNMYIMELIITIVLLMIINILVFHLYDLTLRSMTEKYENEILKQKMKEYQNQASMIQESKHQISDMRHDMKFHLNELHIMAGNENMEGITRYLDDMIKHIDSQVKPVDSGNTELDCVLNYLIHKAKEEGLSVESKVNMPESMKHTFDVNAILGNLLENAIEAAKQTTRKMLSIYISHECGILYIKIKNSYSGENTLKSKETLNGKIFVTTKEDDGIHGRGLGNVKKIVEKYMGIMEIKPEKDYFVVTISMYI